MGLEVSASVGGVYELGILSRRESYPTFKFTINNPPPVPSPPPCIPSQPFSLIALVLLGKEDGGLPIARWGHDDMVMGGGLLQATVGSAQASVLRCPAHYPSCHQPTSCSGHGGGRNPRSSESSVHANPRAWRRQMSAGLDSSPAPYFWLWGVGSPGKWQPGRECLHLRTISSQAWKEALVSSCPSVDEGTAAVGAMRQLQIPHCGVGVGGLEQGARDASVHPSLHLSKPLPSFQPLSGIHWRILVSLARGIFCWAALRVLSVPDALTCLAISGVPLATPTRLEASGMQGFARVPCFLGMWCNDCLAM